jgi:hypothetical protein
MPKYQTLVGVVAVLAGCALLTGCGGTVDQKNFEKLKVGMSSQQVQAILGKDSKEISSEEMTALMREALSPNAGPAGKAGKIELPDLSGARGVRWGDDKKSITVIFMGDRASRIFKRGF